MKFSFNKILIAWLSVVTILLILITNSIWNLKQEQESVVNEAYSRLVKNPQVIADLIVANPELFIPAIESAKAMISVEQQKMSLVFLDGKYDPQKKLIVEYFNFGCSVCSNSIATLKEMDSGKFQVALKHIHSDKYPAATTLAQFFEALYLFDPKDAQTFLNLVFSKQENLKTMDVKSILSEVFKEMNISKEAELKLLDTIKDNKIYDKLAGYRQEASTLGITATPSFVINGKVYSGLPPKEILKNIIDSK